MEVIHIRNHSFAFSLKEFLPHGYIKNKGIEKKIFQEHKKHRGVTELDAKVSSGSDGSEPNIFFHFFVSNEAF